jgi:hypothetical protein
VSRNVRIMRWLIGAMSESILFGCRTMQATSDNTSLTQVVSRPCFFHDLVDSLGQARSLSACH